jgi:hypothetical protein
MIRPLECHFTKVPGSTEQHNDRSLRKSGALHDRLQQVWEAKGALFSSMALFSTRDPGACVDNCAYARRYGGGRNDGGLQAEHILRGELPVYYYAQPYMGSLEAYLAALIFLFTGPAVWAMRLETIPTVFRAIQQMLILS